MDLASWLNGLYLFTTVFGAGVTAVDMLGLLGGGEDAGEAAEDADADTAGGEAGFGIRVRDLLTASTSPGDTEEGAS